MSLSRPLKRNRDEDDEGDQDARKRQRIEPEEDKVCPICHKDAKDIVYWGTGFCYHPVCLKCMLLQHNRLKKIECAMCRSKMPGVLYTTGKPTRGQVSHLAAGQNDTSCQSIFDDQGAYRERSRLMEPMCKFECVNPINGTYDFETVANLENHMFSAHDKFPCHFCDHDSGNFVGDRVYIDRFAPLPFLEHLIDEHEQCYYCAWRGLPNVWLNNKYDQKMHLLNVHKRDPGYASNKFIWVPWCAGLVDLQLAERGLPETGTFNLPPDYDLFEHLPYLPDTRFPNVGLMASDQPGWDNGQLIRDNFNQV